MNLDGYTAGMPKAETPEDAWMFSRLAKVVAETTEQLETYGFGEYARNIQSFFWMMSATGTLSFARADFWTELLRSACRFSVTLSLSWMSA